MLKGGGTHSWVLPKQLKRNLIYSKAMRITFENITANRLNLIRPSLHLYLFLVASS